jgi:hypothetical protein
MARSGPESCMVLPLFASLSLKSTCQLSSLGIYESQLVKLHGSGSMKVHLLTYTGRDPCGAHAKPGRMSHAQQVAQTLVPET